MTGKNTWKRIAAGALSIALVAGAMPADLGGFLKTNSKSMTASADDATEWTSTNSLPSEGNYILMNDVSLPSGNAIKVIIGAGKSLTIDLNGKTINAPFDDGGQNTVFKLEGGTLTIKDSAGGGTITREGNSNDSIVWGASGNMYMEGGTITGVTTQADVINVSGKFIMTGGSITGNTCSGTNNYAVNVGGSGVFCVSGDANVTGNYSTDNTQDRNVVLQNGAKINVIGALTDNAALNVKMSTPGVFTNSSNTSYNDKTKFTSANDGYHVKKNADGQLEIADTVDFSGTPPQPTNLPTATMHRCLLPRVRLLTAQQ